MARCQGHTQNGGRCKNKPSVGCKNCYLHKGQRRKSQKGGIGSAITASMFAAKKHGYKPSYSRKSRYQATKSYGAPKKYPKHKSKSKKISKKEREKIDALKKKLDRIDMQNERGVVVLNLYPTVFQGARAQLEKIKNKDEYVRLDRRINRLERKAKEIQNYWK